MTFKKNMHTMKYDSLFDPLVLLFVGSSYVLTLLVGAFMIQAGQITVGNLVTFITYLDMLVWPLMAIGFLFNITQGEMYPTNVLKIFWNRNQMFKILRTLSQMY